MKFVTPPLYPYNLDCFCESIVFSTFTLSDYLFEFIKGVDSPDNCRGLHLVPTLLLFPEKGFYLGLLSIANQKSIWRIGKADTNIQFNIST
jgi:hypothetical protein